MIGTASWYTAGRHLHRTCTGEYFNGKDMTAASHVIPLGTQVRVSLVGDNDLSRAAAQRLGIISRGIAEVEVTPVVLLADNR